MLIIPAVDLLDGKIVRLAQGDFTRVTSFKSDPHTLARQWEEEGASRLHLVNLSGAKDGGMDSSFIEIVRSLAQKTDLRLQVGGGIRTMEDMQMLIDAGAARIILGTILFTDPTAVRDAATQYGPDRFIAALDVKNGIVQIRGWRESAKIGIDGALQRIRDIGITRVLITAIERDGMENGPDFDLYEKICAGFPAINIIASGGIRDGRDARRLRRIGCEAAVIGKTLLNGSATIRELNQSANSDLGVRVIPCLDVKDGRVVKGTSFQHLRDAGDPVECARKYCDEGADELVFLDIAATPDNRTTMMELATSVAETVNIPFTIGGGIRSVDDARRLLLAGADKISVNSAAVKNPDLLSTIARELGSANTVCAIDARRRTRVPEYGVALREAQDDTLGWNVLIAGGRIDTGMDVITWAKEAENRGAGELLVTSFDCDGQGTGFDTDLLRAIKECVTIPVIASGGGGSLQSFVDAVEKGRADAVLAASVFHFGKYSISNVKGALHDASFPVRL